MTIQSVLPTASIDFYYYVDFINRREERERERETEGEKKASTVSIGHRANKIQPRRLVKLVLQRPLPGYVCALLPVGQAQA